MNTLETIKKKLAVDGSKDNPIRIPDMKRERFALLLADLNFNRGVEIGVHKGYFSSVLCKLNRNLRLTSVDVWDKEDIYIQAIRTLRPFNCELIRLKSRKAASLIEKESLDFAYIDGDHSDGPNGVGTDIEIWEKKVRVGGIVSGHDYREATNTPAARRCKVVKIVDAHVARNKIDPFFVIGESFVPWPTWFWVKQ